MSDESIDIVGLSAIDDAARRAFYRQVYPQRAELLTQHWRWWYRVGALPGVEPLVAVRKGAVVGHAGVIPCELRAGTDVYPALWFIDFAVLPELQGKGLGKRLTEAWMNLGDTYITHCNDNSMRVFRKYGFAERDEMVRYARPLHLAPMLRDHRSLPVRLGGRVLDRAPEWWTRAALWSVAPLEPRPCDATLIETVAAEVQAPAPLSLVRDERWLRWRLLESPVRHEYAGFAVGMSRAVVRVFSYAGVRRLHLLWLGGGSGAERVELARGVAAWGVTQRVDMLWGATNDPALAPAMRRAVPFRKRFRFAFFSRDAQRFAALKEHAISLQAIDSDTDTMYAADDELAR